MDLYSLISDIKSLSINKLKRTKKEAARSKTLNNLQRKQKVKRNKVSKN